MFSASLGYEDPGRSVGVFYLPEPSSNTSFKFNFADFCLKKEDTKVYTAVRCYEFNI